MSAEKCSCEESLELREQVAILRADLIGMQGEGCEPMARRLLATVRQKDTALRRRLADEINGMMVRLMMADRE